MCKRIQRLLISLCTLVTFVFAQDVTLTLQSNGDLDYDSPTADIYGFQFDHGGCVTGASGGDADTAGFTVSASSGRVLGFSFGGGFIPAGSGTLVSLDGDVWGNPDCTLSAFVISGAAGSSLEWTYAEGEDSGTSDDGGTGGDCEESGSPPA